MSEIIQVVFDAFGISQPVTVSDFLWDILVLSVGFAILRILLMFIVGLLKSISRN